MFDKIKFEVLIWEVYLIVFPDFQIQNFWYFSIAAVNILCVCARARVYACVSVCVHMHTHVCEI
jgi:hypothetical protein